MQPNTSIPTIFELSHIFFDDKSAINYLIENKIFYKQPSCPICSGSTKRKDEGWRCIKKSCAKRISFTKHSFFENSKLKPSQILLISYLWLSKASATTIQTLTGHSNTTISNYIKYLTQLLGENIDEDKCLIGGAAVEVEIDECKISKRKYNRGRHIEGAWIFGGVERTTERRVFVEVVANRTAETLTEVILRHIQPGTIILSDCWKAYAKLNELGYTHKTVNHSKHFRDPESLVHTNGIEGTWSGIKRSIPVRNRTADSIDEQLLTYIWRRQNKDDLWKGLINALSETLYY